ncbi:hypothetical protein BU25DRAFT_406249 [Macroventuria anomochaeta]|uniref:Uncharacterized protein n=1 Tax=Macroventuria anomochaeta TaxID=301207 RepID=A0ACB6SFC2_9PLEO|nr:uncharacterized protein BU25DRAFT_406249 [Macroventuria anomochaeta]KAF2632975.1 hypothetical protein BU25DRAFT_406249 [Macroventuria anomochaeta]
MGNRPSNGSSMTICNTVSRRSLRLVQRHSLSKTPAPCLRSPQLPAHFRTPDLPDLPTQVPALGDISDPTPRANHRASTISADEPTVRATS